MQEVAEAFVMALDEGGEGIGRSDKIAADGCGVLDGSLFNLDRHALDQIFVEFVAVGVQ